MTGSILDRGLLERILAEFEVETVFHVLEHLAANGDRNLERVAGKTPFEGETPAVVMMKHLHEAARADAAAGGERLPAGAIEARAEHELHRRGEQQRRQHRQHAAVEQGHGALDLTPPKGQLPRES